MRHGKRTIGAVVVGALLALAAWPALAAADEPGTSGQVTRLNQHALVFYEDPEDALVMITGGTAEEFCAGTATGDPVVTQLVDTTTGALVLRIQNDEASAFVYAAATIADLCDALSGSGPELIAQGTVHFRINDNDLFSSETRTNSFGDRAQGTLTGPDGSTWHVTAQFRAVVLPSDDDGCNCVVVRTDIDLVPTGR